MSEVQATPAAAVPDRAHIRCLSCGGIDTIISTQAIRLVAGPEEWECGEAVDIELSCENSKCDNWRFASDHEHEVFVYVPDVSAR